MSRLGVRRTGRLARRASSGDELFALYGALLAHGIDNDAKGVSTMIPGIEVGQIAAEMRALAQPGRLRRANDCVAQFQSRVPIAALWGDGDKGSADMRHSMRAVTSGRRASIRVGAPMLPASTPTCATAGASFTTSP